MKNLSTKITSRHYKYKNFTLFFIKRLSLLLLLIISINNKTMGQTTLANITTASNTCGLKINVCEGDTLLINPQTQANYKNYKWYLGSVTAANQITEVNASSRNVVVTNFAATLPAIKVIANGGVYILTCEYNLGTNCVAINDTFNVIFAKRPIVQVTSPPTNTLCAGGSLTLNATLLAGSGICNFQWEKSNDGIVWSNVFGEIGSSFTTPSLNNSIRYRVRVHCINNVCCDSGMP